MGEMRLSGPGVSALVSADLATVTFTRGERPLPWHTDLRAASLSIGGETVPVPLADLTLRRLSDTRLQWIGDVHGAGVALEIELGVSARAPGVAFTVTPLHTGRESITAAVWPGELRCEGAARELCWSDAQQGSLFRADGEPWAGEIAWDHATMRLFGLTCDGESAAVIVDTPFDARGVFSDDGQRRMAATVEFGPSLGTLAYARTMRIMPLEGAGHVAVAEAFRQWAQARDLWVPWEARVEENPAVEKLRGAFVACAGYYADPGADIPGAMRQMRQMGFERGYVFSPRLLMFDPSWMELGPPNALPDAALREIEELGYLTAPFLQVEEAGEGTGAENLAIGRDGQPIQRWQIGETRFFEIAKWRVREMLASLEPALQLPGGVHFDTLTAMALLEHWGERPYDRRGDIGHRLEIARYYRRRGKVIASESMRDWGTPVCDLNTSKRFTPVMPADSRVWTVPLSDLVYHDSLIRTCWEHWSYNDDRCIRDMVTLGYHPFGQELTDLLTCSPPVLFPEGTLYEYARKVVTGADGHKAMRVDHSQARLYRTRMSDPETQEALPKALRACRLHAIHGLSRLLRHRFLSADCPDVQETEFASGLRVVANFGEEPWTLDDGRTVAPRSALTDQ